MTRAEVQAATLRRLTALGVTRWTGALADEAEAS